MRYTASSERRTIRRNGIDGRRFPRWGLGLLAFGFAGAVVGRAPLAYAQEGSVGGTVVAAASQIPLSGAQVAVQDQPGKGAVTDASGRFRIAGLAGGQVTLNVRMIGYRPETRTVQVGVTNVRFLLTERPVELDQVVVTGTAGAQEQRTLGNSVARIDAASVVAETPVSSVQNLINGRAPGVVVMPGTGMIGSGSKIRIRGLSTFSLSGDPLVYVDGVRVNNETGSGLWVQAWGSGVVSRLNDFNPDEIESIEILRGPAAATLYGTEAARGVINIITKKGTDGGTRYSFVTRQGGNWFMNAAGRVPTNYWRDPTGQVQSLNVIQTENARGTPVFRTGRDEEYSGNVSGGMGPLRYFAGGEWINNQGAEPNNARNQFSGRTNLQITPSDKFDISSSLGYIQSNTQLSCEAGCGGATWGAWFSTPANLAKNCATADTSCMWSRGFNSDPPEVERVLQDWQDINRFTGSLTANYRPFSWLTNRLAVGTDFTQEKNEELVPYITNPVARYYWAQNANGWKWNNRREIVFTTYDYNGTANVNVTPKVNSATSFGLQYYQKHISTITAYGQFFPAPGLETVSSAATKPTTLDDYLDNNTLGFYGQEQVGWQDRLFLTGALRVDNNSAFGKDIKWVTYPKASLSWVLNEEPFLKERLPSFVSTFKLRTAYGESGQQPEIFTALRTFQPVPGPNGTGALTPQALGNSRLGPERGKELEAGFDASFLGERLGLNFTYYNTHTYDAILLHPVAPSTGFGGSSQYVNAGEIKNTGIEAMLKAQLIARQSYGWDVGLNVATNNGKVVKLSGGDTTISLGRISHRIGYAPWSWFERRVVSAQLDSTGKVIRSSVMCDDGKGGVMNCYNANGRVIAPKVYLGRTIPAVEGSVTSGIRFLTHFRLYTMVDFKTGYKKYDNNLRIRCQIFLTCLENIEPLKYDAKKIAGMQSNATLVDWVITDAKFAKLREVSLDYEAPDTFARYFGARSLGLNVAARNLHTWTPYTGLDPENFFLSGSQNFIDQAELPQLTSVVVTVRLNY
jgi:TonB-linked SusC/RagA family outer membrane protein